LNHSLEQIYTTGVLLDDLCHRNRQSYPDYDYFIFRKFDHNIQQFFLELFQMIELGDHPGKCLSLYVFLAQRIPLQGLDGHFLVDGRLFHVINDVVHLFGSRKPDFVDVVVAEFKTDGENVLEDCFRFIYFGESIELVGYLVPDSPLFGVFLKHQKDIYQILSY
jgi:hypothetical protein